MPHLDIRLLGVFQATLDGEPVRGISTYKSRGLLAYLVVGAEQAHTREKLAGMFWPERPERRARGSLSQALFTLRSSLGDNNSPQPFFCVNRETIQFNGDSDYWLDVQSFEACLKAAKGVQSVEKKITYLEEAASLFQGDFLESFSIADSSAFESWCLLQRERLHRQMNQALRCLIAFYEQQRAFHVALQYAWKQLDMDPWREDVHAAVMRLLALSGRRSEALVQYETCCRILAEELDVQPMVSTTRLYNQIREEKFDYGTEVGMDLGKSAELPSFLSVEPPSHARLATFVARDHELEKIDDLLELTLNGRGRVAFVAGEAGSGKSALMAEFARRAQQKHPDLVVAAAKGTAYTGVGDPYAAFRDILGQLSGEVEHRWLAGAIHREQALRLWRLLPLTAQALIKSAPDLLYTFTDGSQLLKRAKRFMRAAAADAHCPDWLSHLEEAAARRASAPDFVALKQIAIFEQFSRLLSVLAYQRPLLLLLDDLQWADAGSTSLLFYLGKHLTGSRLLILGAYRPEEIMANGDGKRNPLSPVIHEFQRDFGDIIIRLGQKPDQAFVEAIVDSESNCLPAEFRDTLFHLTGGHPLFTVELLHGLQERGDLVKDDRGCWQVGTTLDWQTLPPRVEGVIAERIDRLPEKQRRFLQVASIQGESFLAEAVARVQKIGEQDAVNLLSGEFTKKHRLVRAQSIEQLGPGEERLSHYQFRHYLFQKYLYNSLDLVERSHLHMATGDTLEALYGERTTAIAVQLAHHFTVAGNMEKAVGYLFQAGNYALKLSANEEAVNRFNHALGLLEPLPETPDRLRQELSLQLALGAVLKATRGYGAPEVEQAYTRARNLSEKVGEKAQLVLTLIFLASYTLMRPELQPAIKLGRQAFEIAKRARDPLLIATAQHTLGYLFVHAGRFNAACNNLREMQSFYDPQQHASLAYVYGHDYGITSLAWETWPLWYLGYPETARQRAQQAIELGLRLEHPFSLTLAYSLEAVCCVNRREAEAAREFGERTMRLATEHEFVFFQASAKFSLGWAMAATGNIEEGIRYLRDCLATWQALGVGLYRRATLVYIAEIYLKVGQIEHGLEVLAEIAKMASLDSERYHEAELYRVKGELWRLANYPKNDIESCFRQAIQISQQQKAKSLELRATTSLCRLWSEQGKVDEALQRLEASINWFTEGFETADFQDANELAMNLRRSV